MNKVLVTGATGFIGRQCLPLLQRNLFEVHAVSSSPSPASLEIAGGIHWHQTDLLDRRQLTNLMKEVAPQSLLHLAWYAQPREYWTSDKNLEWVQASLELARCFAANGGRRAVIAGSCAEYDWSDGYCAEAVTPLVPTTLYGSCKHSLNLITEAFFKKHGISSAWGRIFYVYGPHEYQERLVPTVVRSLLQGEPAFCSSGDQVRDFLHVEDVAAAFVALLQSDLQGSINIASGIPCSIKDIATTIASEIGRPDLLRLGAREREKIEAPVVVAITDRLHNELRFEPAYQLKDGIIQTIEWWRDSARLAALI